MSIKNRVALATRHAAAVLALAVVALAVTTVSANATGDDLEGVIHIHPGEPAPAETVPDGSWIRIQQPGDLEGDNNFLPNPDSANIADPTYTLLEPSHEEEFELGQYQTTDGDIVEPVEWDGIPFDIFTLPADPTEEKEGAFPPPQLESDGGEVTGDLRSWTVLWGTEEAGYWYSQGANSVEPDDVHHPDGNLHGTYDDFTNHIKVNWSSEIVDHYPPPGGGFDGFVGYWQIEGTFEPYEQ